MNDYRHRPNYNRRFEPASSTSMGKFFSNRLRDSLYLGGPLPTTTMPTTLAGENFDQTTADNEATPEPPAGLYDLQRSVVTPSSTSSNNDSYFTHTSRDIHKFSRRVELSSGYNILKNRTSSRPGRLPTFLQGRAPLAQLNPIPTTTAMPANQLEEAHQRRLSFTDHQRTQNMTYNQQILQQFNIDGTRRPFSSDSPLPPPMPTPAPSTLTGYYISSAPPMHNRIAYDPIEPLKLPSEQEDNSIAALSRELRAAAYPTTRKSSHHSPTRETSPLTSRYSTRTNPKRAPRSLPKLGTTETSPPPVAPAATTTVKMAPVYHHHEMERSPLTAEHRIQSSSAASLLLDQFFSSDQTSTKEASIATHELTSTSTDKSLREPQVTLPPPPSSSALLMRTPSVPNDGDDTTLSFVSKYARLAPIIPSQLPHPTTYIASADETNPTNHQLTRPFSHERNHQEETLDTLHDLSSFHEGNDLITDDLLLPADMLNMNYMSEASDENYSYVPLKEDLKSTQGVPLLELDELETNSDMSESQLVPIIYAKELANEIDLLQKAHMLKQQQRSIAMSNADDDRVCDNNSIPPPANMELLNFEALEEEFALLQRKEYTPLPSPTHPSTMMEISSSPLIKPVSSPASPVFTEMETPIANLLQHSILAHNRLSPWFKLPTELWFKILSALKTDDLHRFSYVCKRFYLLAQDQACQHRVTIQRRMKFEQTWLDAIKRRRPLALAFIECRQQDLENTPEPTENSSSDVDWLDFFQSIGPSLVDFTMTGCYHEPFTANTLLPMLVQTCSNLHSLELRWNNITETTLNHLINYQQFTRLQTLDLTGCQTLDDTLLINIFIRSETDYQLRKLILHACTNITWVGLDAIAVCLPNLLHLNISRCIGLKNLSSNQSTTCFSYWPQLESIDFGHLLTLTDNDLAIVFEHCKYLKAIVLDHCIHLTDQTIHRLSANFQSVSLDNCTNISTNALLHLNEQCPHLETLSLSLIKNVNDQCLLKWSDRPLTKLRNLGLDYCTECTLTGIERLIATHVHLQELSLNGNLISTVTEQRSLEQKSPHIKFVFQ